MFKLIPDDYVIVIRQNITDIDRRDVETGIIYSAQTGFPGTYDKNAMAHTEDYDNPHCVSMGQLILPDDNGGKWLILGEDAVIITDKKPIFPEDVHALKNWDTCVKTDPMGAQSHLDGVMSAPFCVYGNVMALKGNDRLNKRMFFGTDVSGTIGFNLIPGKKVIP